MKIRINKIWITFTVWTETKYITTKVILSICFSNNFLIKLTKVTSLSIFVDTLEILEPLKLLLWKLELISKLTLRSYADRFEYGRSFLNELLDIKEFWSLSSLSVLMLLFFSETVFIGFIFVFSLLLSLGKIDSFNSLLILKSCISTTFWFSSPLNLIEPTSNSNNSWWV